MMPFSGYVVVVAVAVAACFWTYGMMVSSPDADQARDTAERNAAAIKQ
jgi:hypothetical protein